MTYTYTFDYYTDQSQEAAVDSALSTIYSGLGLDTLTEQQKVFKIYEWITNNVSYDYDGLAAGTSKTIYTAYGALNDGKAVCQGFAGLFYRMCMDNGIDCRIVTGTSKSENHAWNIVKVDGLYYYVDATWDCKVIANTAGRQQKPGTLFYFLRNSMSDHTETDGVTSTYTIASESLSGLAVSGGEVTDLCGETLTEDEAKWYTITKSGTGCEMSVKVTPAATGLTDIVLLKQLRSDMILIRTVSAKTATTAISPQHRTQTAITKSLTPVSFTGLRIK